MRLLEAFRSGTSPRLAFSGSGGKTTALFCLGREYLECAAHDSAAPSTVFLAATTHIAVDQLQRADLHIVIAEERVTQPLGGWPAGLLLFTGQPGQDGRTVGLSRFQIDRLFADSEVSHFPLLIEADGSRQHPLKAPAPHEPVIPTWVDTVVVVVGLLGLGKPLTAEWVHRPERFSALAGISPGQNVSVEALARVLSDPSGGLQGIPERARRIVLLNQADNAELQAAAKKLVPELLQVYQAVVIASLGVSSPASIFAVHEPAAGVILAGGAASRFGQPKQILPWKGQALVWHAASTALSAGLRPVVVVTGHAADQVHVALAGLPVAFAHNPDWAAGQSASVITGLRSLPMYVGSAIFLLADQPLVPANLVRGLVDTHAASLAPIVAPQVQGQRANPVLFDRSTFPDLLTLTGDAGGRVLFSRYPVSWLLWNDASVLFDIDTPEEYQALLGTSSPEVEI
jgi:molybdenum cofactor cytidylyltransferase